MRLVTLYKDLRGSNSKGQFQVNLEDDLNIKPKSKIALVSANIKYNDEFIDINNNNNSFRVNVGANSTFTAKLNNGTYTQKALVVEVQKAINSCLTYGSSSTPATGLSTNCFIEGDTLNPGPFNINFGKSKISFLIPTLNDDTKISKTKSSKKLKRILNTGTTYDGYAKLNTKPINKGPTATTITMNKVTNGHSFIFGLINSKVNFESKPDLNKSNYTTYISNDNATNKLEIDGNLTNITAENGASITLHLTGGKIKYFHQIANPPAGTQQTDMTDVLGLDIDYRDNLGPLTNSYYYCSLKEVDTEITYASYSPDPFFGRPPLQAGPFGAIITIDFNILLPVSDLAEILGYNDNILRLDTLNTLLKGDNPIDFELSEDAGLNIILENLNLNSLNFMEEVEGKQSILHSIPQGIRTKQGVLSYISGFPQKIDINNQYEMNLKNLLLSFRNARDNSIIISDEVSMTINIYNEDE